MKTMPLLRMLLLIWLPIGIVAQPELQYAEKLIAERNYQAAEQFLVKLAENKEHPALKNKLGEVYGYQLKWDQAIDIYRELTLLHPQNAEYFFRYGGVLAKKAQNSNAFVALTMLGRIRSSFRMVLKLEPNHIPAHWAVIDLYVSLPGIVGGSMSRAYEYAHALKQLAPLDGYLALGYVYEYDDQPEKAKKHYLKAMSMLNNLESLDRNQLNYQIGKICSDYGIQLNKGIDHLNSYIEYYTVLDGVPLEWAYLRLAKIYRKKSNKQLALVWINKSLDIDPDLEAAIREKSAIERL